MEVKRIPTKELKPFAGNPRTHSPEQIDKIVKSFGEFGWTSPILITKGNMVVAGHARLEAAKKAGIKEVPVIVLPFDGEKARAYAIADNKLTLDGDWDFTKLADLLTELDTGEMDLSLTGFDEKELQEVMDWTPDLKNDEKEVDENIETKNQCPKCGYEW